MYCGDHNIILTDPVKSSVHQFLSKKIERNNSIEIDLDEILGLGGEALVIRKITNNKERAIKIIPNDDLDQNGKDIFGDAERRFERSGISVSYNRCKGYLNFICWQCFSLSAVIWIPLLFSIILPYFIMQAVRNGSIPLPTVPCVIYRNNRMLGLARCFKIVK